MNPRFKINLIGLTVALSFVLVGFGLGEPPRLASEVPAIGADVLELDAAVGDTTPAAARRGALMRHLAMPYVSFAALTPRRES